MIARIETIRNIDPTGDAEFSSLRSALGKPRLLQKKTLPRCFKTREGLP